MPGMLEEKDAIREVMAEYCFRLDSGWYDGMAALFAENGTWETAFGKATGREAIAALAGDIRARAGDQRPREAGRGRLSIPIRRAEGRAYLQVHFAANAYPRAAGG